MDALTFSHSAIESEPRTSIVMRYTFLVRLKFQFAGSLHLYEPDYHQQSSPQQDAYFAFVVGILTEELLTGMGQEYSNDQKVTKAWECSE